MYVRNFESVRNNSGTLNALLSFHRERPRLLIKTFSVFRIELYFAN